MARERIWPRWHGPASPFRGVRRHTVAYRELVDSPQVRDAIGRLDALDSTDTDALAVAADLRPLVESREFDAFVETAITDAMASLESADSFAVRSSATAEDLPSAQRHRLHRRGDGRRRSADGRRGGRGRPLHRRPRDREPARLVGLYLPEDPGAPETVSELEAQGRLGIDFGKLFEKGQGLATGQCDVKAYNRRLRDLIVSGRAEPSFGLSHREPLENSLELYEKFDDREEGVTKVVLEP